ncbi:hypothetical protein [Sphingomonas sp. UYP23]
MNDMSSTIVAKSDQINAADLIGNPRTITVKEVRIKAGDDQPVSVLIEGDNKAFRPCKGVRRLMVRVWGADASQYIGRSMTLFCDPSVTWAGKEEGGIRVSHMSGLDEQIVEYMRTSRAATKPYKILPLAQRRQAETEPLFTFAMAKADLESAADLPELEMLWKRKIMAPYRASLGEVLTARKNALTPMFDDVPFEPEGKPDADHGEGFTDEQGDS